MDRHSVPQNIMDVEFKLFGSFTIKQFGYLAAGIVFSLLIFFSPLPGVLKLILMPFSAVMGMFLGLVRINGQASTVFVANFIAALFTSQIRVWDKKAKTPDILVEPKSAIAPQDANKIMSVNKMASRSSRLKPLESLVPEVDNEYDMDEKQRLSEIDKHFNYALEDIKKETSRIDQQKRDVKPPEPRPDVEVKTQPPSVIQLDPNKDNLAGSIAHKELEGEPIIKSGRYASIYRQMQQKYNRPLGTSNSQDQIDQIQQQSQVVNEVKSGNLQEDLNIKPKIENQESEEMNNTMQNQAFQTKVVQEVKDESVAEDRHNVEIPQNRKPNIIAGIVVDKNEKPIPYASVEIKDKRENLLRKQPTSVNGTFSLNTPLPDGTYHIDVIANGFKFARFELILSGVPLPNYKFKAK